MMDKKTNIDIEMDKYENKLNEQKHEIPNPVDRVLAYGSANLGLSNIEKESVSEERIKVDLKK